MNDITEFLLPRLGLAQVFGLSSLAVATLLAGLAIYRLYLSPLSNIPGPKAAAISKLWLMKESMAGNRMRTVHDLHLKHGKVVRVAPTTVSFSDPSVMSAVYNKFSKAEFYLGTEIVDGHPHSMASLEAKDWSPIRRMIAPTYSISNVASYEGELTQNVRHLCDRIDKTSNGDNAVDILHLTRCVASDAVGLLGFGEDWGATVNGHSTFLQWIDGFTTVFIIRGMVGKWFCRQILMKLPIPQLRRIFDVETQFINHTMKILEPVKAQVDANPKMVDQDERNTLAIRCLGKEMSNGKVMPFIQTSCEIFGHVYAGTDTTSVAVSYALLRLSENPAILQKLRKEVTEAAGDQHCADISTLSKLPYLNAVIHETLRTDGPACSHLERTVAADGIVIDGHYLPPGTTVAAQGYTMHRDPAVYTNPNVFNPDRWLTKDPELKKAMMSQLMPFGFGPRICPGQVLAFADMRLLISSIVKRYDFTLAPGQNMELEDHFVGAPRDKCCKMYFKRV